MAEGEPRGGRPGENRQLGGGGAPGWIGHDSSSFLVILDRKPMFFSLGIESTCRLGASPSLFGEFRRCQVTPGFSQRCGNIWEGFPRKRTGCFVPSFPNSFPDSPPWATHGHLEGSLSSSSLEPALLSWVGGGSNTIFFSV